VIHFSKESDDKLSSQQRATKDGDTARLPAEIWCLHGALGAASDWRDIALILAKEGITTRSVDLWRFLQCESLPMPEFGKRLNADAQGELTRGMRKILCGYSMGGRLALHALIEGGPWEAAVIISANPGLRDPSEAAARRVSDTVWATQALTMSWAEFLQKWNAQPILGAAIRSEREDRMLMQRRREIARSFVDWSLGNQQPLWDKLSEIKIPVLWVAGENDEKFLKIAKEAVSLSDQFSLAIAPSASHRVPWENGEWLAKRMAGHAEKS
jgi:2-succinyl-6-hydroxy-2,4-cyclohexadiene-1-carboxylate synthase